MPTIDTPQARMYLLPEEDLIALLNMAHTSGDPETVLLHVWDEATKFDLDLAESENSDQPPFTLAEMVAATPELPPESLHSLIFTYTPES